MFSDTNTNSCSDILNRVCESGYSLYFPCIKNVTRGENTCFEFYVVDNVEKQEMDLRDVNDITLNMSGRYNCSFIEYVQREDFSEMLYKTNISDIIELKTVKLYVDLLDEKGNLEISFLYNTDYHSFIETEMSITGIVGEFIKDSDKYGVLDLTANDTYHYMCLGWCVVEKDKCEMDKNIYDNLIVSNRLIFDIDDDYEIHVVYKARRIYQIKKSVENLDSYFIVENSGEMKYLYDVEDYINVFEGYDIKISCIPDLIRTPDNILKPLKFIKWDDGFDSPYRILKVGGDSNVIALKAYCSPDEVENIEYIDDINPNLFNNFFITRPEIRDPFRIEDGIIFDNLFLYNCEITRTEEGNGETSIFLNKEESYLQIVNINDVGRMTIIINGEGDISKVFLGNDEILHSDLGFVFDYNGESLVIRGRMYITSLYILKEVIYDKGKCRFCLNSDETMKLQPGEIIVDGGVVVNENPYGISPVKIANVTTITPLKINI